MAFKSARCTRYENISDADGNAIAILIGGEIEDDTTTETRYGEFWIKGEQFDNLPPADPLLDGTPDDARFQAIQFIIAQFATLLHKQWTREMDARPKLVARSGETLSQLPVMTQLLPDYMLP